MKLHQLQALVAAVDHGSIRAAARALHLTQAALTKSLRQLEDDSGAALLIRQSRGITLTDAGQRLLARARLITRQLELAQDDFRQHLGQDVGSVSVGLTPYLISTVLGESFRWFRQRFPQVELRLTEGLVTRVIPALREGSLDFAIVANSGDVSAQEFQTSSLQRLPQALVVRVGHPVLRQPTAQKLCALEWVLPGPFAQGLDENMTDMFRRAGVAQPRQITRCDALAAIALVRQSDALCVMPDPLLGQPESQGLTAVTGHDLEPPAVDLMLLTRPEVPLTAAAAYFARCLTDAIAGR